MSDFDLVVAVLLLGHSLIALAAAIFVSANRKPSLAIAWIMAVVFIPVIGALFFLLVGSGRLHPSSSVDPAGRDRCRSADLRRGPWHRPRSMF